jgi:hypothetical protein
MVTTKIDSILSQLLLDDETEAKERGIHSQEIARYKSHELGIKAKISIIEKFTPFEVHLVLELKAKD